MAGQSKDVLVTAGILMGCLVPAAVNSLLGASHNL